MNLLKKYLRTASIALCIIAFALPIKTLCFKDQDIASKAPQAEKIILTNGMIKMLDGVPFALDGTNIGNMKYIKIELMKLQYGIENPKTKKKEGKYLYNNQFCSIHTLAMYEKEFESGLEQHKKELERKYITRSSHYHAELDALETNLKNKLHEELLKGQEHIKQTVVDESTHEFEEGKLKIAVLEQINQEREQQRNLITRKHISNPSAYDRDLHAILQEHQNNLEPLQKILEQAKVDFLKITHPFMEQAHGVKWALAYLIEESCIKRGRWDSFLLKWGGAKETEEIELFNNYMNTCMRLDTFCSDLSNFITDIINSCPKGREQYLALLAEKKQEKNN